jgi:hypothetical protein
LHSKRQGLDKKEQQTLTHNCGEALSTTTILSSLFLQLVNSRIGAAAASDTTVQKIPSSKIHTHDKLDFPAPKISL